MRVKCLQGDLSNALTLTNKAVDSNSTLPVLNNVLLKAQGKNLQFITTNLELAIEYSIETQVINEGEITLPSRLFTQYISYLKANDEVEISTEAETAHVHTSDSKTTIKGIPASEFPPIPVVENQGGMRLKVTDFKRAIQQVVFSAAMNTTRPILAGVYFLVQEGKLKMVTTDSYRLSEKVLPVQAQGEVECIIPARTLLDLGSILDVVRFSEEDQLEMAVSKNQIMFSLGTLKLTSRLIEGQFPNYQQILPKASKTEVICEKSQLVMALKRINLFAKQNNNKIILSVNEGKVVISTEGTQYGQGEVDLSCQVTGEPNQIALNSQYILDVLSGAVGEKVKLKLDEKTTPAVFQSEGDADYLHIIMPLKL